MPNRLAEEKSPYLLQHANNPVDWYPWGPEAFEKAKSEDKPIFLSIGYSTCHWCHVMERESFESALVAEVLNRFFVPIKLDREERPDVDRIYMLFVQATTGGGGWPMSVWLTPQLKPFYGGTYFPPDNRYGRPGFRAILEHIAGVWKNDRAKVEESGDGIVAQLKGHATVTGGQSSLDIAAAESLYAHLRRSFDSRHGGFGGAPKFPRPVALNFLHRWFAGTKNEEALEMSLATLRAMAYGGMYDQLGGGFHRYSVDSRWFVPHFEKMLYDQGQLVVSYVEAAQFTGDPFYQRIARETLDYVLRDMTSPGGGFYSAEDADSVIDPAQPHHKGEGWFYIFTQQEIEQTLDAPDAQWFIYHFGVQADGNVAEDPHHEFTGRNILFVDHTVAQSAKFFNVSEEELTRSIGASKQKLLLLRATKIRPYLDDKILTAWNGLMISAFARAAACFNHQPYAEAAVRAAGFIRDNLLQGDQLLRRSRNGEAAIPAFLDDYSFLIQALIDLYESTFDVQWIQLADQLAANMISLFEDAAEGGFFSTTADAPNLLLRMKEDYDGAEPSGNSYAVLALLKLAAYTGNARYQSIAERALGAFANRMSQQATSMPHMYVAWMWAQTAPRQVVLAGENVSEMKAALGATFAGSRIVFALDSEASRQFWVKLHPQLQAMQPIDGQPAAYVCHNFSCQLPIVAASALTASLQ